MFYAANTVCQTCTHATFGLIKNMDRDIATDYLVRQFWSGNYYYRVDYRGNALQGLFQNCQTIVKLSTELNTAKATTKTGSKHESTNVIRHN